MSTPNSELRSLTDKWHDGTISQEEALYLEERLLASSDAREYFFQISELEAALPSAPMNLPDSSSPLTIPARHKIFPWWQAAALFLFGLFLGALIWKSPSTKDSASVSATTAAARVTGMLGISWEDASQLQRLVPDLETRVQSGLIELTFASGARAVLEGPASFHIKDENSMRLDYGKLVADVPKGAEGFTVTYADGKIVDIGTEFGVEIARDGKSANLGVFRGEIEYRPQSDPNKMIRLLENHAIVAAAGNITSIPFIQKNFTRKLPSREFSWKLNGAGNTPQTLEYDVSHLIWKPGTYRIICKWMNGQHGLIIESSELLLDGEPIAEDTHEGFTGITNRTRDNTYKLIIPPESYRRGTWTLRIRARADTELSDTTGDSAGVILVEEGLAVDATQADFIGTWEYLHDGKIYRRTFAPDGTASMTIDGKNYPFTRSRWDVKQGTLFLKVDHLSNNGPQEEHLLRDADTLIFTNLPYRNARKITE